VPRDFLLQEQRMPIVVATGNRRHDCRTGLIFEKICNLIYDYSLRIYTVKYKFNI
jgi:hypothetical protein